MATKSPLTVVKALLKSWEALQVELHGKYPLHRVKAFHAYSHTSSFLRVALVCLLTPLPCIVLVALEDFIPLNDPELGLFDNWVFWIRAYVAVAMVTITILEQFRHCLPRLPLSNAELLLITVIATTVGVSSQFSFAYLIGFPLPFSTLFGEMMWTPAVVLSCGFLWGKMLLRDRSLLGEMLEYVMVLMCQVALTLLYPAYIFIFTSLSGWQQNLFVLVLPIMKILTKNWIARFLNDLDHLKPEVVIFNIDVFSALYVSCSLTTRSSFSTTIIVMAVDMMQMGISIYDINQLHMKLHAILRRLPEFSKSTADVNMLDVCIKLLEDPRVHNNSHFRPRRLNSYLHRIAQFRSRKSITSTPTTPIDPKAAEVQEVQTKSHIAPSKIPIDPARVAPEPIEKVKVSPRPTASMTQSGHGRFSIGSIWMLKPGPALQTRFDTMTIDDRVLFVDTTARMLFLTEFVLLVEFTEVMMPIIYTMYLVVMSRVPNRQYYPRLAAVSQEDLLDTIGSVLVLATLELVSLIGFAIVIRRKLRVSPFHQVAFVLDKQFVSVQSKLILWMFYIVQTMLEHFGVDFSMKFAWLKDQKSP